MAEREENPREEFLLEERIGCLERELAERYLQLGRSIYEVAEDRIGEINRLVDRLVESKRRLSRSKGQIPCAGCLALNPEENRYCGRCGRLLEPAE